MTTGRINQVTEKNYLFPIPLLLLFRCLLSLPESKKG
jgi:hypothetical protein